MSHWGRLDDEIEELLKDLSLQDLLDQMGLSDVEVLEALIRHGYAELPEFTKSTFEEAE